MPPTIGAAYRRLHGEHDVWPLVHVPLSQMPEQQTLPQHEVLVQPQLRGMSARPQPRTQVWARQEVSQAVFTAQQLPWKQTLLPEQAVGQQNRPLLPSLTQCALVHSPSAVQA